MSQVESSSKETKKVYVISFKADPELKEKLDEVKERMSDIIKKKVKRSEMIRMALKIGLSEIDESLRNIDMMKKILQERCKCQ